MIPLREWRAGGALRRWGGLIWALFAQAVVTQTLRNAAVPERALQLAADVGRMRCSCASGVLGAVDCC